jgi:signal transduction histidine kinase
MIYLGRAILDDHGGFAGIVLAGIPISYFEGYFSTVDMGPESAVSLEGLSLKLIARWPRIESLIGREIPSSVPDLESSNNGKLLAVLQGADGLPRLIAITRFDVQGQRLYLGVAQTWGAILGPWRASLVWIVLFAVLGLLVLGTLTLFMARAIAKERRWSRALLERETRLMRQARELARARDAAESANQVRSQFLANMSHELRTPLNAVVGFADILDQELFGPLGDQRYKEFARDILDSGRQLLEIINNILDLTKLDAGKVELDEQEVDITDLLRISVRATAAAAQAAGVTVDVIAPDRDFLLRGDPSRLKQMLVNLLANAVKFSAGGHVRVSATVEGDAFVLRVVDDGMGMTDAEVTRAMQRFGQIDGSLARRHQGTGLGLPLTNALAMLHGGRVILQSISGKGTTASIHLPRWRIIDDAVDTAESARRQPALAPG